MKVHWNDDWLKMEAETGSEWSALTELYHHLEDEDYERERFTGPDVYRIGLRMVQNGEDNDE